MIDPIHTHIMSEIGIIMRRPVTSFVIRTCDSRERTWAEKTRDELIWRLKKNMALRNKWAVAGLTTLCGIAIFSAMIFLMILFRGHGAPWFGIIGGQLTFIGNLMLRDKFECDPNYIYPKR